MLPARTVNATSCGRLSVGTGIMYSLWKLSAEVELRRRGKLSLGMHRVLLNHINSYSGCSALAKATFEVV